MLQSCFEKNKKTQNVLLSYLNLGISLYTVKNNCQFEIFACVQKTTLLLYILISKTFNCSNHAASSTTSSVTADSQPIQLSGVTEVAPQLSKAQCQRNEFRSMMFLSKIQGMHCKIQHLPLSITSVSLY
ncbi:hypothetical protein T11_5210 [Trichinella zimbabwensis]|uniref:Uncharacterized protein n=1 Tax=Trichinella zimbabwensis TaxID=268475 RepID=A0A0V1I652_9BILA|nr:hypothetical protein T11_5210 [Trichinella zimbabwensis]